MRDSSDLALPVRALLWILAALPAMWGCAQKSAPPAPAPPEVSVVKLTAMPVTLFEEYVGQTEAVDTVEIRARVGGILERQAFEDGARVKKGDVLFVLDQQPYIAALEQAKATLAQAQAAHVNSKQNLARAQPLSAEQAISQQELDAATAKERSDAANVQAAEAQVRQGELNLGYTTIRAPRDGDMSKALIKPGGLVNASSTLLTTLYSVDPLYVNFTISEQKLGELQKQLTVNPRDHNNSTTGARYRTQPRTRASSGSVRASRRARRRKRQRRSRATEGGTGVARQTIGVCDRPRQQGRLSRHHRKNAHRSGLAGRKRTQSW